MKKKDLAQIIHDQIPFLVGVPAFVWQSLFFCFPLFFILYMSFIDVALGSKIVSFTFNNYKIVMDHTYIIVIVRSLFLAFCNACLCMIFGYPIAYFLALQVKKFKILWLFLLIVPFWTNFLLHVYAWFFVLERHGFLNTFLLKLGLIQDSLGLLHSLPAVLMVTFYCYFPFMVLPLYSVLDKFDPRLLEASLDLGANSLQTFFRVMVPVTLPGLQLGFFLVFVSSFGEFAISSLVGGDKSMFVGSLISFLFLEGNNQPLACAYTVVSSCAMLLASVIFYRFSHCIIRYRV